MRRALTNLLHLGSGAWPARPSRTASEGGLGGRGRLRLYVNPPDRPLCRFPIAGIAGAGGVLKRLRHWDKIGGCHRVVRPFTPFRKCLYFYHRCCTKNSTDISAIAVSRDGRCGTITLSRVVSVVEMVGGSATPRGCAQSGASRHAHQSGCRYAAGAFSGHACRNPARGAPRGPLAFLLRSPKFGLDHFLTRPSARTTGTPTSRRPCFGRLQTPSLSRHRLLL